MDQIGVLQLSWSQGYTGTKAEYIDKDTISYKCGNCVKFVYSDGQESVLPSPGDGVGALAIHSQNKVFAFTEACLEPRIFVFTYPVFQSVAEMKGGASLEYTHLAFSSSDYLVSVTSLPEFEMTIWQYETGEKLCSAALSHTLPTSVSFNPTNWRQICLTTEKDIGVWNIEQAHDQYIVIKEPIRLPSVTMPTLAVEEKDRDDGMPTRSSTRVSRVAVDLPKAAIAGLVGEMAEEYEELEDQSPRVRPLSHCWDATGDVYIGCEGGQLIKIDTEMLKVQMLHNPLILDPLFKQDSFILGEKEPSNISMQSVGSTDVPLGPGAFNSITLDRHHLYAGGEDGTVRTLDVQQGSVKLVHSYPIGNCITSIAFSPNYSQLAIGSDRGTIHLYEPKAPDNVKEFVDVHHGYFVASGFLCPGTDTVVTVREDGEVQAWDIESGKLLSTIPIGLHATALVCCPISNIVAVGSGAGHIYYIDFTNVNQPRIVKRLRVHAGPIKAMDYDINGHFLISGSDDGHVIISHARASRRFEPMGHTTTPNDCDVVAICTYTKEKSGVIQVIVTVDDTKKKRNGATRMVTFELTENIAHDPPYASLKHDLLDDNINKVIFNFTTPSYGGALTSGNIFFCLAQNTKHIHKIIIPDEAPKKEYSKDSYLEPEVTIPAHSLPSGMVCLSAHQKWLASCSPDGVGHIRGVGTMLDRTVDINPHSYTTGGVHSIKFSFDALHVVTTGFDGTLACYKWEEGFSSHGAMKSKSAQEVAHKHHMHYMATTEDENQTIQGMAEWSPMPSRPGTLTGKTEQDPDTEKPKTPEVEDVYSTPTPTPGADSTWIEIREMEAHKEEDKKYSDKKKHLRTEIREMRKIIQAMMRENEIVPDIEKLGRHEFDLDLEEQGRLQADGLAEVQRIKEEIELDNLAKMYLRELIKKECWDEMVVKGRAIGSFNSNLEVANYPMRARSEKEVEELERVTLQRTVEVAEMKERKEILEQVNKSAAKKKFKRNSDSEQQQEEELLDPDDVSDGTELPSTVGSRGAEYGGGSDLFYSQFELSAREQKINQIVLLEDAIHRIKLNFNKEFEEMLKKKEQEITRIKDKNRRIKKIVVDLGLLDEVFEPNFGVLEKPESLLVVEDEEVKVDKYLTPEQQKQREKDLKIEEERKAKEKGDNARERALDTMMGGVLEVKKEDELKKDVPVPAFMSKPAEEWTEEEQKLAKEYEKKVKDLQEEREKYRKQLETELKKLQGFISDGAQQYDDMLNTLFKKKIKTEMVIYQEELKIVRLKYALLVEDELNTQERELVRLRNHKKECKVLAAEAYNEARKNVDNFHDGYDILLAEDKVMDKAFKREFHDVSALQVDQLYKLFRRRPRGPRAVKDTPSHDHAPNPFLDRPSTARQQSMAKQSLEAAMIELDKDINIPEGVEPHVWERMCAYRRQKIESEQLVKAKALILADMNAFMQKRQEEDEKLRNEIDDLTLALNKVKDDKIRFHCNLEIQLLLKQGQVEVDAGPFIHDYGHSILIHKSVVEDLNSKIRALGEGKISSMVESKDFRKGIVHQEWEHKMMLMEMEDLKNKMRDIQMLKVTREIQAYLHEEDYDARKVQEMATFEQTIVQQKEVHEKNVEEKKRILKDLHKVIREKQDENKQLDVDLEDLNVTVNERRHIHEVNAEKRSDGGAEKRYQDIVQRRKLVDLAKAQAQEVAILRAEVERLRMRTFPALVQVER